MGNCQNPSDATSEPEQNLIDELKLEIESNQQSMILRDDQLETLERTTKTQREVIEKQKENDLKRVNMFLKMIDEMRTRENVNPFEITVKNADDTTFQLPVFESTMVLELKLAIEEKTGSPVYVIMLHWNGEMLRGDEKALRYYRKDLNKLGVDQDTVHLTIQ